MQSIRPQISYPMRPGSADVREPKHNQGETTSSAALDMPPSSEAPALGGAQFVDGAAIKQMFDSPADYGCRRRVTWSLALRQAFAARNVLYYPGRALQSEIGLAAKKFLDITNRLTPQALKIVTKRLFSAEGLLAGRSTSELASILGRLSEDAESEAGCATAIDRTAFISLMGDIGALHADAKKASRSFSLSSEEKKAFVSEFSAAVAAEDLSPLSDDILERVAKLSAGTNVVGPSKKDERRRMSDRLPRKGLYNLGDEVDEELGVMDHLRIPQIIWRPMEIATTRLSTTHEPFVAHMSGAPGEVLMVWDMLRGKRADDIYCAALRVADAGVDPGRPMALFSTAEQAERRARLAGACAMLVGIGHHSAVEVAEGALKYLGQDLRGVLDNPATQDAAHLLGAGAATDLFVELFDSVGQTPTQQFHSLDG